MMRPSMKMGLIGLIGICLVFYQYHLSSGVRFDQVADLNTADSQVVYGPSSLQSNDRLEYYIAPKITEDTVSKNNTCLFYFLKMERKTRQSCK